MSSNRYGRGSLVKHQYHGGHFYNSWKKTPRKNAPASDKYYGQEDSFYCLGQIRHKITKEFYQKLEKPGSYYTQQKDHVRVYDLIVIPDLDIIVYTFYG